MPPAEDRAGSNSTTAEVWSVGLAVFVLALGVRAWGLGDRSFWLDEASTIADISESTVAGTLARVGGVEGGKSPLYFVLLRGWAGLFGMGEASLRWPSAIAGSLSAALVAAWIYVLAGVPRGGAAGRAEPMNRMAPALIAGVFCAMHPTLIAQGRDARPNAFSHAMILGASILATIACQRPPSRATRFAWCSFPVLAAVGATAHLFSAFYVAGLALGLAGLMLHERRRLVSLAMAVAAFGCLLCTQIPITVLQVRAHHVDQGSVANVGLRDLLHFAREIAGGGTAGLALVPILLVLCWRGRERVDVRLAAVAVLGSGATVLLVQFLVLPVLVSGPRYLSWGAFLLALILGTSWFERAWWRAACIGVVSIAAITGPVVAIQREREYAEDWRAVCAYLHPGKGGHGLVLCSGGGIELPLRLYYRCSMPVRSLAGARGDLSSDPEIRAAERVVGSGGRVWLVWSHTGAIADVPLKALESRLGPAVEVETQWAIRVFRFGP